MENNSTSAPSPLSPTNWPPEAFATGASILVAIAALGVMVLEVVAGIFFLHASGQRALAATRDVGLLFAVQAIAYVPIGVFFFAVLPSLAKRSLLQLGLRAPRGRDIAAAFAGLAMMWGVVIASELVVRLVSGRQHEQPVEKLLQSLHDPRQIALAVVVAVVLAPFIEELTFRGFVFNALLRRLSFWPSALISGLLFSLAHADLYVLLPLALGGAVLAHVYYRTGCLWSNMLTHGMFNAISVAAIFVFHVHT